MRADHSLSCGSLQSMRTERSNTAWESDGSDASLLSERSSVFSFAFPGCCRKAFFQKLSGVHVVPLSGPSIQPAVQCTVLARQRMWAVLKFLTGTTVNVAGVQRVHGTLQSTCHAEISFDCAAASRATTAPVVLRAVKQPALTWAASKNFERLKGLLYDLHRLSAVKYVVAIVIEGYPFSFETPAEGPSERQVEWASFERANEAASMNRPIHTVAQQHAAQLGEAQRELATKGALLRRANADLEAMQMQLAIANQTVMRFKERPLELDAGVLESHRPGAPAVTAWTWPHLNQSLSYPAWQWPVAEQHYGDTQPPEPDELASHTRKSPPKPR